MFIVKNWFTFALFLTPLLSWAWPELGAPEGYLHAEILNKMGIVGIFLISGMCIQTRLLVRTTWKIGVHIFIQLFCFVFFPFVTGLIYHWVLNFIPLNASFKVGILLLSCLPTTITSCVVLTRMAKGNEAVALFNGVLSNLCGVFLSPLILQFLITSDQVDHFAFDSTSMITSLALLVLLPVFIGHVIHNMFTDWTNNHASKLRNLSNVIMLFIMYSVFCDTFLEGRNMDSPFFQIVLLSLVAVGMHFLFLGSAALFSISSFFSRRDRRAILFTAPQKTLAMGMPLVTLIMELPPFAEKGVALFYYALPLLLYHHAQLLIAGLFLPFLRKTAYVKKNTS